MNCTLPELRPATPKATDRMWSGLRVAYTGPGLCVPRSFCACSFEMKGYRMPLTPKEKREALLYTWLGPKLEVDR